MSGAAPDPDAGPQLYLVTPGDFGDADTDTAAALLAAHPVSCLRLALATTDETAWRRAATLLQPLCHARDVALVVTDHYRLVGPLGLDGVHLADRRTTVREARKTLGADAIVGAFVGTSRHDGMTAAEAGADYVAFGPVGDTGPLGDGTRADPDLFAWWAEMIETPVVAEGAIGPAEAASVAAHADFIVPDPALWRDADPAEALTRIMAGTVAA